MRPDAEPPSPPEGPPGASGPAGGSTDVNGTDVNGTDVNGTDVNGTDVNGTDVNGAGVVGMLVADFRGRVLDANDEFLQLIGYTRADLAAGLRWDLITPPEWRGVDETIMRALEATGEAKPVEKEYVHKAGHRVPVLVGGALLSRETTETVAFVVDLTRQRAAEAAAAAARGHLAAIVTESEDAIIGKTLDGVVTSWNAAAERLFGYPAAEMVGQPVLRLIPPERHGEEPAILARIARGERVPPFESVRVRKDGTRFPVALSVSPVRDGRDGDGRIVGAAKILRDISAQRAAEAAVAEREALFRHTFEQAAVGMAHVGLDGRWLRVNARLAEIVGYTRDELLARTFQDITHPDDLDADLGQVAALLRGEAERYAMDKRYRGRDGRTVWVRLTVSLARRGGPAGDAGGGAASEARGAPDYFISVVEDISARKRAEDDLAAVAEENARLAAAEHAARTEAEAAALQLQEQAVELEAANEELQATAAELEERTETAERERADAERHRAEAEGANRTRADFLASMSHELRTPLNAIQGYVRLLEEGIYGPVPEAQRAVLDRVARAQTHLLALVTDVLNFARLEEGRVTFDVRATRAADVIGDVVPLVEPQLRAKGLELRLLLPDELGTEDAAGEDAARGGGPVLVWADREKLGQVLLNLLANAVKFTPATQADGRPGRVTVALTGRAETPDVAYLRVHDTGIGVPRDKQDAIFEPFVQVSTGLTRTSEGTGLGLAISRDLARGMGGDLRIRSAPGGGSTFTLTLRRVVDAERVERVERVERA